MAHTPDFDHIAAALKTAGLSAEPSRFQGALCGALCVRDASQIDPVTVLAEERPTLDSEAAQEAVAQLAALRDTVAKALAEGTSEFGLLLPDDESVSLKQRTEALAAWCDGFLFGLASAGTLDLDKRSEEVREAVSDITHFTQASVEHDDDTEVEEEAYSELVEYLRVAVQLIHVEHRGKPSPAGARMH
ncbi:UPF0149 family protein [Algiphilus sp.]|uniref:UPF0149 family protein n=1 Tax=Algiphilus sp. TaxID=1872431 RepID=UPI003B528A10